MTQALYAHMNNKTIKKKRSIQLEIVGYTSRFITESEQSKQITFYLIPLFP
jgi:hypothetical protein